MEKKEKEMQQGAVEEGREGSGMENKVQNGVHGFKVFNPDWTCRGFQYEVGKTYEMDGQPACCGKGFHFCLDAADCFDYYKFNPENKAAEVYAFGEVDYSQDDTKCCTDKIKIIREIPWDEVLRIVNTGKGCTGLHNTGNCNTGDCNTGDCNTGNRNTGDCNTGNWNTGDWNQSSFNTGCFMTQEQKIYMFNKPSGWTYNDWVGSDARRILDQMPKNTVKRVHPEDMTDEEKAGHPGYKTTGGYLKVLDISGRAQMWWDGLAEDKKSIIKKMPNFDPEIFRQCTGIDIRRK